MTRPDINHVRSNVQNKKRFPGRRWFSHVHANSRGRTRGFHLLYPYKMPRAGPSRSQRQVSQTQAQTQNPPRTQRYGRSQRRVEDEEEEDENIALDEEDDDMADENDGENVRSNKLSNQKKN